MPRDKETGKPKGFAFVMYEDQRSTVLAVDNLTGGTVLGRTIRVSLLALVDLRGPGADEKQVDHVKDYKQPGSRNEEGEFQEPEAPSMNALPPVIGGTSLFPSLILITLSNHSLDLPSRFRRLNFIIGCSRGRRRSHGSVHPRRTQETEIQQEEEGGRQGE
jgi:RNA recognition motif-containing protein